MSNDVAKSIILFSLHVISITMKFQNALFLSLFASLYLKKKSLLEVKMCKVMFVRTWKYKWGTSFSFVHILEFKRIIDERFKYFFYANFLVNESSSYGVALICFWTFQMVTLRSLKKYASCILLHFRPKQKKQSHRLHTSNTLHTRSRLSIEYTAHEQFSTEMTKNTNAHTNTQTLSRSTVRRRKNKRSTARTSIHSTQEGHWQLSIYFKANMHTHTQRTCNSRGVLRTGPPLTRVESLTKKTNIRAHVCCEKRQEEWK